MTVGVPLMETSTTMESFVLVCDKAVSSTPISQDAATELETTELWTTTDSVVDGSCQFDPDLSLSMRVETCTQYEPSDSVGYIDSTTQVELIMEDKATGTKRKKTKTVGT